MPQSSSDVFSPRQRLPLDPFAALDSAQKQHAEKRLWEVDLVPRSGLQPQVVLVLGEPRPSDILPLLTSPHLSHSLVLIATHAPGSLAIPVTLLPGPAVRVLRLAASLNVHDAGALRLVNVLEKAQRVARLWRHSAKGKVPAGASQRIIQLAQDGVDGEFTVVEPFAFTVASDDRARKPIVTTTSAQSQNQSWDQTPNPKAEQRSSLLYPSPPPSIASASESSIPASPTPKKAVQTPAAKSRFSILSLSKSPSTTSLRDSQSPKQKKLHKSSAQLSQLVKESAQAVENEQVLLNHYQSHGISGQAHTRIFDAIVNFLPAGGLPDKALLKCAILVTTLSAQYLALPPGSSDDDEHVTEEDGEEERNGTEQDSAPNFEGRSHTHIHVTPTKKPIKASDSASNTISTSSSLSSSTSPPSSFASSTPTQKPHRYHYQRRSSLLASGSGSLTSDGSLPIPPPMASYPSSSSSVVSKEPQSRFSMMSVISGNSPSSSSSVPTASRPELHLHTSSSTGISRSSLWAQAPPSNLTSSQTTPATSPLPSPGLSALPGVPLEVDLVNDDISNGVAVGMEQVAKRKKSIKHRFSMIFGGRPDVQWKPPTQTQLHGDVQRPTSTRKKSMSGSTRPKPRTLLAVNAHIVHVLPQGWTPPEDAYPSSQNRRHSYASSLSSASGPASGSGSHPQYQQRPSYPHHYRSGSGESAASTGSTFGKPKLVQGIEQFLLSFAVNVHQPGHDAYAFSSPGSSRVKAGKRPMTSSGIVSSGESMKGGWSSPGTRSMSMTKGQLASLVEAEGKKEKELQLKNGKRKKNGRGPPVPFLIAPGGFGRLLMGGGCGEGGKEDVGQEVRLTIGELVLLGGLDAQSAGRAWVDVEDVVVLGGGDRQMSTKDVVSMPGPITVQTSLSIQDQPQLHSSPIEMDSLAEDHAKPESDEETAKLPVELGASLLPTPPNSQSSSVRSRSQSHSGTSSEESAAAENEEADAEVEVEAEQADDLEALGQENLKATKEINSVDNQASKSPAVYLPYPTPPERIYSSEMQKPLSGSYPHDALQHQRYAEPPMMITLTSPTVGSPSPPPHHARHRRLASNESASASTSALPLSGPPPSSWHGQLPNVNLETAGVPHKDVKVPRAIYVSSGSVNSSSRSKSDSRLPLPRMDVPPSSFNFKSEVNAHPTSGRKRVKSHDGFGSALRKLGLGMFGRTGEGSTSRER